MQSACQYAPLLLCIVCLLFLCALAILYIGRKVMEGKQMAGFVGVGRSYGAAVVARRGRDGWVWSQRVGAAGLAPAPAALFVPFGSHTQAAAWAQRAARATGWVVVLRTGRRCSCWSAGAIGPAPAWAVKVVLPAGWSAGRARGVLPLVSGAAAGAVAPAAGPSHSGQRSALATFI